MKCAPLAQLAPSGDVRALVDEAMEAAGIRGDLFAAGDPALLHLPRIAVAGTREATPWTLQAIEGLGAGLAAAGACVVSGGAVGTDCAAHAGALQAGGATVVIPPCPLEDIDLCTWRPRLAPRWAGGRVLFLSPFPRGTRPHRGHPLVRNRLIAALCSAGVAGATGLRGGTNHFLRLCLARRLPLYVLDSRPRDPAVRQALGALGRRGARLFTEDQALEARVLTASILAAAADFDRRQDDGSAQLRWCDDPADYLPGESE